VYRAGELQKTRCTASAKEGQQCWGIFFQQKHTNPMYWGGGGKRDSSHDSSNDI
jgi:hypothetical protein